MSNIYLGINEKANEINSIFVGDENNKAQQILDLYYGVNNKAIQIPLSNPILPKEYQQVEYIESSGTQYINSLVPIRTPISAITEIEFTDLSPSFQGILGAYKSSTAARLQLIYLNNNKFYYSYYQNNYGSSSPTLETNIKYKVNTKFKYGEQKLIVDDTIIRESTVATGMGSFSDYPLYIFANNNVGSIQNKAYMKLYSMKIYISNATISSTDDADVLYRNFYPCYRKQDNVAGLYDLAKDQFYTNAGTGTFNIGPKYEEELLPND